MEEVVSAIEEFASGYHRLVLLVAPIASGKSDRLESLSSDSGWPVINVNQVAAEQLLELGARERVIQCKKVLAGAIEGAGSATVLLDNIEMLFDPGLQQDPLRLLQSLSRHRTVVATWRGGMIGSILTYASPDHPEYRRYENPQALVVAANLESGQRGARPDMEPST